MIKKCTVIVLFAAILAYTFSESLVYISFYANRDYIAKNLCENRDKPLLHCCGRCQLKKKLKEENQKNNLPQRMEDVVKVFPSNVSIIDFQPAYTILAIDHAINKSGGKAIDQPSSFFHLPGC